EHHLAIGGRGRRPRREGSRGRLDRRLRVMAVTRGDDGHGLRAPRTGFLKGVTGPRVAPPAVDEQPDPGGLAALRHHTSCGSDRPDLPRRRYPTGWSPTREADHLFRWLRQ